nr:RhoGAP domain containing protein [Haemonchus contortus]
MTVVASYGMVLCGNSSDDLNQRYRGRIEKVKFGVPINEAFAHDIPATLLVLLLKVNKEGPQKKDIWRAPGNQAQVRKLSHIMQHGRLVNIANFSVYTAASVIKKFLSKLPGGIFGVENEQILFNSALQNTDLDKQRQVFYRIFCSLPVPSQHLLVLLFGTFRTVADSSETYGTKMNPDAIAISVAPSLFHSCIHDGRQVKVEDVQRFKLASEVVRNIITSFGHTNLFPRECYEFYARITGRTLRVDENWLFTFQYPSRTTQGSGSEPVVLAESPYDEPSTLAASISHRLSSSVGEVLHETGAADLESCESDLLRPMTSCEGDSSRSFTYLEWVHENQARRMRSRSEWFLSSTTPSKSSYDLFTLKAMPGSFSFTTEDEKNIVATSDSIPLLSKKSFKIISHIERLNPQAKKLRQPFLERTCSTSSPKNNCSCNVSSSGLPSSCGHSLDSQEPPLLPSQRVSGGKTMYSRSLAHSIGGETWLMEVISDEIWKKKRSFKKKH